MPVRTAAVGSNCGSDHAVQCRYAQQQLVATVVVTTLFILTPLDRMIATESRNLMLFVTELLCATWCDAGKGRYHIPGEEPVLISISR